MQDAYIGEDPEVLWMKLGPPGHPNDVAGAGRCYRNGYEMCSQSVAHAARFRNVAVVNRCRVTVIGCVYSTATHSPDCLPHLDDNAETVNANALEPSLVAEWGVKPGPRLSDDGVARDHVGASG